MRRPARLAEVIILRLLSAAEIGAWKGGRNERVYSNAKCAADCLSSMEKAHA